MPPQQNLLFPELLGREFNEAIEYIRRSSLGTPKKLTIDLSTANNNLPLDISGNFIYVIHSAGVNDTFDIRFNETREPSFTMVRMMGWYTPFYRFYITNTAQVGASVELVYGSLARPFLDLIDNRSVATTNSLLEDIKEKLNQSLPLADATRVNESAEGNNGDDLVYTVPVGKKLYLSGMTAIFYNVAAGNTGIIEVRNGAAATQYELGKVIHNAANMSTPISHNFKPATIIPAGWDININTTAAMWVNVFINGFLEDA